jgi:L-seryl-tRNA(Ser) seleniumtransferase
LNYHDLGVSPIINAFGTVTILGGSLMSQEVLDAMADAAKSFVDMHELLQKAGERLAQITRNEAAYITSGAASGLMLAAAACITGNNPDKIARLPDTTGMPNEIIIQKCQRMSWDRFLSQAGARLVEVGQQDKTSVEDLESAINENTVAIMYYSGSWYERNALPLDCVIKTGKRFGIPVIVDAAANLPPVDNLWRFTEEGAGLVIFSGGKGLRGPQNTGLILGKKHLIEACRLNGSPNNAIGRVCKVGQEEIMGLLTAVQQYVSLDHGKIREEQERWIAYLVNELAGLEGIEIVRVCPGRGQQEIQAADGQGIEVTRVYPGRHGQPYPRLRITFPDNEQRDRVVEILKEGTPKIYVAVFKEDERCFCVDPSTLHWNEVQIIADRLKTVLKHENARSC